MTGNHTEQPPERETNSMENQISKNHSEGNSRLFSWTILVACSERCSLFPTYLRRVWTMQPLAKGITQRQNNLNRNKYGNENTALLLIGYLQKQVWFCKISSNKLHSGGTFFCSLSPSLSRVQAYKTTLPRTSQPTVVFSKGQPQPGRPQQERPQRQGAAALECCAWH